MPSTPGDGEGGGATAEEGGTISAALPPPPPPPPQVEAAVRQEEETTNLTIPRIRRSGNRIRHALVAVCISIFFMAGILGLIRLGDNRLGGGKASSPASSPTTTTTNPDKAAAVVDDAQPPAPPPPPTTSTTTNNSTATTTTKAPSTTGTNSNNNKNLAEQLAHLASAAADNAASKAGSTTGAAQEFLEEGYIAIGGCTPETGPELQYLVEVSSCPIITLVPGTTYVLKDHITVRRPVMVLGRPILLPIIDAHNAYRAFMVEAGGLLDLRFVEVWRGIPLEVVPGYYFEIRGGVAWIRTGGVGLFTGCVMLFHRDSVGDVLVSSTPQVTYRIWGGFLLLEAGTLRVLDCHFLLQTPGVLIREVYTVGGYVLVVSGNAVITGCSFTASFLFITVVGLGNFLCVLNGNAIVTGTVFTLNAGFAASQGVGILLFVGGGTSIFTGCTTQGNLGFLTSFGAGLGLFTGGGVSILTGMVFGSSVIMSVAAGIGMNNALGGGVIIKTGVVQYGTVTCTMQAVLGVATFVGAGVIVQTDCVWTRVSTLAAFYGAGGSLYLGAGVATLTNCASAAVTIIVLVAAAGGDHCVMAGWLTMVNHIFFKYVVIAAYYGQGVDTCLVAGGALLVNCAYTGVPPIVDTSINLTNVYVAGNFITLNRTTDIVLATHRRFEIWDINKKGQRQLGEEEEEEEDVLLSSEGAYPLTTLGAQSSLAMRHVSWREISVKDFKEAFFSQNLLRKREKGSGAAVVGVVNVGSDWPLHSFRQLHLHHHRRQIVAEGEEGAPAGIVEEETPPVISVAVSQQESAPARFATTTIPATDVFNSSLYTPLYPFSPILVPAPDSTQVTTDKVFVGTRLGGGCQACDVTGPAFAGGSESASTGDLFNGQGAQACEFRPACHARLDDEEDKDEEPMWMSYPSQGIQPNTTLAVIELLATYTPSSARPSLQSTDVLRAVNQTMQHLGLSQRLHLRVVADDPTTPYPREEDEQARRLQRELAEANAPCSATSSFRAYVVTDQRPVASETVKILRQAAATTQLTKALQAQDSSACKLAATTAWTVFVPSLNASALMEGMPGQQYVANVLGSAAKAMPQQSSFNDDALVPQSYQQQQQQQQPTAAVLALEGQELDTARVNQVVMGQTYRLALGNFPKGRLLSIRLVPKEGPSTFLGMVGSTGQQQGQEAPQEWTWAVSTTKHTAGEHFVEVTSQAKDAFAYSQAFELLGIVQQ